MQRTQAAMAEPPSSVAEAQSYPARAFGVETRRYWLLLAALVEGLDAYERARRGMGGGVHAQGPLPAA